ncbi:hypothetical protein DUI87_18495 [Hirundo rustica rustica]|uniref:Uncharacterized protein n=1 Tax=Hirundo rustica rustica TaxID=333673 RepID=A0A3M0JX16_HIRRU|nr:hypothetical protein DUI87_18495 [Hirundo rustica rustica]
MGGASPSPAKPPSVHCRLFFSQQLEDAHFIAFVILPQQGLDPDDVGGHAFPVVLLELFVTVIFPSGLHGRWLTIPSGNSLANGVFLIGKLLAYGLFPV